MDQGIKLFERTMKYIIDAVDAGAVPDWVLHAYQSGLQDKAVEKLHECLNIWAALNDRGRKKERFIMYGEACCLFSRFGRVDKSEEILKRFWRETEDFEPQVKAECLLDVISKASMAAMWDEKSLSIVYDFSAQAHGFLKEASLLDSQKFTACVSILKACKGEMKEGLDEAAEKFKREGYNKESSKLYRNLAIIALRQGMREEDVLAIVGNIRTHGSQLIPDVAREVAELIEIENARQPRARTESTINSVRALKRTFDLLLLEGSLHEDAAFRLLESLVNLIPPANFTLATLSTINEVLDAKHNDEIRIASRQRPQNVLVQRKLDTGKST